MASRYTEVSVQGSTRVSTRIIEPTGREKARQVLVFLTSAAAIAAACMIIAGVSIEKRGASVSCHLLCNKAENLFFKTKSLLHVMTGYILIVTDLGLDSMTQIPQTVRCPFSELRKIISGPMQPHLLMWMMKAPRILRARPDNLSTTRRLLRPPREAQVLQLLHRPRCSDTESDNVFAKH
jgi:hypothetical protein